MEEQNNIDKLFSEGLQDFQMEYDQEEVWQNVQKEEKKRRATIWIWLVGLTALVAVIGLLFLLKMDQRVEQPKEQDQLQTQIQNKNQDQTSTRNGVSAPKEIVRNENLLTKKSNEQELRILDEKESLNENSGGQESRKTLTYNNQREEVVAENQFPISNQENGSSITESTLVNIESIEVSGSSENRDGTYEEGLVSEIDEAKNEGLMKEGVLESREKSLATLLSFPRIDDLTWEVSKINIRPFPKMKKGEEVIDYAIKPARFSVQYNAIIYRPKTRYSYSGNGQESEKDNKSSQDMLAYSNQILADYKISDHFHLSAGLEQMQVFQKFYWEDLQVGTDRIYSENAFFVDENDVITMLADSTFGFIVKNKIRQSQQILSLYSVPIGVSYQSEWNKWTLGGRAQVIVNIAHSFTGFSFNQSYDDIVKEKSNSDYFSKDLGISVGLSPFVEYGITEDLKLKLHGEFRWNARREIGNGLNMQSNLLGVGMGIRYLIRR